MKVLVSFFLMCQIVFAQQISFSKDTLVIDGNGYGEDIKDSLIIKNIGDSTLTIDSIYSANFYGYRTNLYQKDSVTFFFIFNGEIPNPINIEPEDSAKFVFYMPDLCPICTEKINDNFEDTLVFVNNSINAPVYNVFARGQGYSDIEDDLPQITDFRLYQNYPNPFNPSTTIKYSLPQILSREGKERSDRGVSVTLKVYDILGREITTLVNKNQSPGNYEATFNAVGLPSGIYFYKLTAGNFSEAKKMILMK